MSRDKTTPFVKKRLLGKILLERGLITQSQLKHALEVQEEQEECLGQILVDLGYVEERDVVAAFVIQCHIPYIAIDKYEIHQQNIHLMPGEIVRKYRVIPLDRVNDILSVVMVDPLDTSAQAEIKRATHCRLAPFVATREEINTVITRWYNTEA